METQTVRMDAQKLKEITNASHSAVITMLLMALRIRARTYSNIPATKELLLRMGEKIVDEDYQKFWKDLQAAGIGSIVYGRKGQADRFQWHYSLKNIASVAIEGKEQEVKELASRKPKRMQGAPKNAPKAKPTRKRRQRIVKGLETARKLYTIPIRNGVMAEVIIPADLSPSELEKIKTALTR